MFKLRLCSCRLPLAPPDSSSSFGLLGSCHENDPWLKRTDVWLSSGDTGHRCGISAQEKHYIDLKKQVWLMNYVLGMQR